MKDLPERSRANPSEFASRVPELPRNKITAYTWLSEVTLNPSFIRKMRESALTEDEQLYVTALINHLANVQDRTITDLISKGPQLDPQDTDTTFDNQILKKLFDM